MRAVATWNTGYSTPVPLTDEETAAFTAIYGPHLELANDLRDRIGADRLIVRNRGAVIAESAAREPRCHGCGNVEPECLQIAECFG